MCWLDCESGIVHKVTWSSRPTGSRKGVAVAVLGWTSSSIEDPRWAPITSCSVTHSLWSKALLKSGYKDIQHQSHWPDLENNK